MEEKLLSIKDLSARWQKDEGTIRRYVKEKILSPCNGVPGMMFHPKYIAELEGVKLEKHSVFEFRKLQKENTMLKQEVEESKKLLREYQVISAKSLSILT
ncbi:histidine kinase [Clostridium sp. VAP51]|uniref:histidine kinase n=1 Tax=Clostridium sp. VAP51 TaxID=2949978 RepID=UPI002079DBBB|nr:histidine kinase [Clostridium sp. VAP51]